MATTSEVIRVHHRTQFDHGFVADSDVDVQADAYVHGNVRIDGAIVSDSLDNRFQEYARSQRRLYVSVLEGNDNNHGQSLEKAFKTIKKAAEVAEPYTTIFVIGGQYYEEIPILLSRQVSVVGDSLRTALLYPAPGHEKFDYFHVHSHCYLVNLRFMSLQSPGYCVAFPSSMVSVRVNPTNGGTVVSPSILYSDGPYFKSPAEPAVPLTNGWSVLGQYSTTRLTDIVVVDGGSGYGVDARVVVDAPPIGRRARVRIGAVDVTGSILNLSILDGGSGYSPSSPPSISILGPSESTALLQSQVTSLTWDAWAEEASGSTNPLGYKAFSKSTAEMYETSFETPTLYTTFPEPKQFVAYAVRNSTISSWTLEARDPNTLTWTVVDTRTNVSEDLQTDLYYPLPTFNPPRSTDAFRLIVGGRRLGQNLTSIGLVEFYEEDVPNIVVEAPETEGTTIERIEVVDGGLGYETSMDPTTILITNPPLVEAPSAPAVVSQVIVEDTRIVGVELSSGGAGYTRYTTVITVPPPTLPGGRQASLLAITKDDIAQMAVTGIDRTTGKISNVTITYPGSGYVNVPHISVPAPRAKRPLIVASPYVQNCSNITGPFDDLGNRISELHPVPYDINNIYDASNPEDIRRVDVQGAGGGIRVDGHCVYEFSPLRSFVCDAFTQVAQGGVGFFMTNRGYAQLVSTFGTFCVTHVKCTGGSFVNCTNSTTDFGREGLLARGHWQEPLAIGVVIAPTTPVSTGSYIESLGYRSKVVSVINFTGGEGYEGNVTVEIDPPTFYEAGGTETAYVEPGFGGSVTYLSSVAGRVVTTLDQSTYIEAETNSLRTFQIGNMGEGYMRTPSITVLPDPEYPEPTREASATAVLSGINPVTIAITEGRPPDYLSIARIAGNWYTVTGLSKVPTKNNAYEVTFFPTPPYVNANDTIEFHVVSYVTTGSHTFEYAGSADATGCTYNALPEYGGIPLSSRQIIEFPPARVFSTSTDQLGNFNVGELFGVDQLTGEVAITTDKFSLAGLSSIGPFRRNGIPVGTKLQEVSPNNLLISSLGAPDDTTVPTQLAVKTYVDRYAVPRPDIITQEQAFFREDAGAEKGYTWQYIRGEDIRSGTVDCERLPANVQFTSVSVVDNLFVEGVVYAHTFQLIDPDIPRPLCGGSSGGLMSSEPLTTGTILPVDSTTTTLGSSSSPWAALYTQFIDVYAPTAASSDTVQTWRSDVGFVGSERAVCRASGSFVNATGVYGTYSDARLKANVAPARSYLEDLASIPVVSFEWKDDPSGSKQLGVIAQEVQKVFPAMVEEDEKGILSVKTSVFVPMLLTAIQTLHKRLTVLEHT